MTSQIPTLAQKVLSGQLLSRDEALFLTAIQGDDRYDLFYFANKIRLQFVGRNVSLCSIVAAKAGACSEDCRFCAQSAHHHAAAKDRYTLPDEQILKAADIAASVHADSFGIVNSGRAPTRAELQWLKPLFMKIAQSGKTRACATLGTLTQQTAQFLHDCGVRRINHNLETSRNFYPHIVSTHPFDERIKTIQIAKQTGFTVCSGGIFGMGESWEDRVDMMLTLRDLDVDVMPINFLNAIDGTPLEGTPHLPPLDALKIISLARFILPTKTLKIAGGREKILRDLQSWIFFAGANSVMIGNYLTTCGRDPNLDHQLLKDLDLAFTPYTQGPISPNGDPQLSAVLKSGKHAIPILLERETQLTE